jgi:hypothetical protein
VFLSVTYSIGWHLDIAGPLPETKNGNRYALVAIDHYSK